MLKRTPLYDAHVKLGAKIVEFGGFEMPVQYSSIIEEHKWVRSKAGLFDVSHMGEIEITGPRALEFVSYITSNDPAKLEDFQVQYSALLTEKGTFVDDILVYRLPDRFLLVVNASNTDKDFDWIMAHKFADGVEVKNLSDEYAELALQGPVAEQVLQRITDIDLSKMGYYHSGYGKVLDKDALISRTGYTGEDGFEIYLDPPDVEEVFWKLLDMEEVKPAGLGARDTLRLEMGYCLYGNDIDETTNALEAGLKWIVAFDKPDFIGKKALLEIKERGVTRRRVGFETERRGAVPRHGQRILDDDGNEIGHVTSGTFSPSLKKGIGMGYVAKGHWKRGTEINIEIRNRLEKAVIVKMPFYKEGTVKK